MRVDATHNCALDIMSNPQEIARLLAEPTNYTYNELSLIGSSCQHIHIPRLTEAEYVFYLHLITLLSAIVTAIAIYCIIFQSAPSMGKFKLCLLTLQSWTFVTDFMLASLATPRVFFPIIGGRPLGIFIKLGITVPVQLYVGFGCFGAMVASIILSFLYRHQVTVNQDNILKCNRWFQICVMIMNYVILSNALLPALFTSPDSQLATKIEILRNEACPAKDLLHPDSYVLQSSVDRLFPYFCGLVVFVGCQCAFMGLHCSWILFFSTLTTKLSKKTRKMQAKLLVALVAQLAIPTTLCYCPMAYFAITTLVDHYWQLGYWICTGTGILSSLFTIGVCWFIMNKHTLKQKTWKKLEYQMILLRVFFDVLTSITSGVYFLSSMFTLSYSEVIPFDVSFMIGLISSSLIEMRSYLAVVIAIERSCATIFSIHFFRYRKKVPNISIIGFIITMGIALCVVMFWYCELKLPLKEGCTNFNCAAPTCYQDYHAVSKTVYSSLNALFSGILCIKLVSLSWTHRNIQSDLRKANLLSLTDGLSTLTFELFPAMLFTKGIVDFNSIGPVFGVLRQIGRAVEATVMAKLM
ncbi:hypothetical protein B9Z55_017163 [Caenorhabditis nigoni]|uniref:Uncharacterized protein n=1 Tax=Caenorhabditis nigoni TaxID=1611254 RepID=A0A2G5T8N9_9PELO|nr:hypothetical protein B9Z55_017163 [Caenorhabditis nigoni]